MTMAAISAVMEKVATVGNAHDFASAACGVHVGDGRGNRNEDHRHDDTEHQVDEEVAEWL
ncbi:MAG: hypothetical protein PUB49_12000 [Selenomonadaceae bacterium]|nr:hypothetical protein [Selenomonadaceae bacterium]